RLVLAEGFSLVQVAAPESFFEKTLKELAIRNRYEVNVVAVRRTIQETDDQGRTTTRQFIISVPMPDSVIKPGDVLLLIGSDDAIAAFPTD
ncbi:MAG TPA: TrkA C-terminal domain-containing protein, partial [Phycisphaerae bacterium]|nr:TrkA C-terminal domain-containing protein [Phycisphaerae bacterium]